MEFRFLDWLPIQFILPGVILFPLLMVFLSHDVDWPRNGPPRDHVLARRTRFDEETVRALRSSPDFNPYYGIPRLMEIEKELGVRSTFFFRPRFDNGASVVEYSEDIHRLVEGGWEVGVHLNDVSSPESIAAQKMILDRISSGVSDGTRVHYLRISYEKIPELAKSGFSYDSSFTFDKNTIDPRNAGILKLGNILEFPITFMDAYLFSYMQVDEDSLVGFVIPKIVELQRAGSRLVTILWHDNVLAMKGGRKYPELLRSIYSLDGVEIRRGVDVLRSDTAS